MKVVVCTSGYLVVQDQLWEALASIHGWTKEWVNTQFHDKPLRYPVWMSEGKPVKLDREDPYLVELAHTQVFPKLGVLEIPDGVVYDVEYDHLNGGEKLVERHRVWRYYD